MRSLRSALLFKYWAKELETNPGECLTVFPCAVAIRCWVFGKLLDTTQGMGKLSLRWGVGEAGVP